MMNHPISYPKIIRPKLQLETRRVLVPALLVGRVGRVGRRRARDDGGEAQGGEEHRQEPCCETHNAAPEGEKMRTWWFMVVYVGLWWFMVVYVGLCWFMLVYVGFMLVYVRLCWFMVVNGGSYGALCVAFCWIGLTRLNMVYPQLFHRHLMTVNAPSELKALNYISNQLTYS